MAEPYESRPGVPYQSNFDPVGAPDTPPADQAKQVAGHAADSAKQVAATAGEQAAEVRDNAAQAASDVVENVKDEAAAVIDEAKAQGRRLYSESMAELRSQAETGQARLAELVRTLTDELQSMVSAGDQRGPVTQFASTLQDAGDRAASWLESRGPQDAVSDLRRYAARNPMAFLAAAAGIGFVGSRLARGLRDAADGPDLDASRRLAADRTFAVDEGLAHPAPTGYGTQTRAYDTPRPAYETQTPPFEARVHDNLEDPNR